MDQIICIYLYPQSFSLDDHLLKYKPFVFCETGNEEFRRVRSFLSQYYSYLQIPSSARNIYLLAVGVEVNCCTTGLDIGLVDCSEDCVYLVFPISLQHFGCYRLSSLWNEQGNYGAPYSFLFVLKGGRVSNRQQVKLAIYLGAVGGLVIYFLRQRKGCAYVTKVCLVSIYIYKFGDQKGKQAKRGRILLVPYMVII